MYFSTISSMLILQCLKKFFLQKCLQVQLPELSMRGCKQKKTSEMSCNLGNSLKTFGIGNSKQLTRNSSAKLRNCSVRCRKQQRIPKIQKCLNKPAKKEKIQNAETIQLRPTDPPSRSTQIFTNIVCHRVFCCSRSSISTSNVNVTSQILIRDRKFKMLKKGHHLGQHKSIQAFVVAVFNKLNELNYQCDAGNRKGSKIQNVGTKRLRRRRSNR